jgi:hypothetical protein
MAQIKLEVKGLDELSQLCNEAVELAQKLRSVIEKIQSLEIQMVEVSAK